MILENLTGGRMSENQEIINDFLKSAKNIRDKINALENDLKAIERDIVIFSNNLSRYAKTPLYARKNALMVRLVNSYIVKGLSVQDSIYKTAEKLKEPINRVLTVYAVDKNKKNAMRKFAVLFMIDRLARAGYKKPEIAKICGYSEKYVFNLIKKSNQSGKELD